MFGKENDDGQHRRREVAAAVAVIGTGATGAAVRRLGLPRASVDGLLALRRVVTTLSAAEVF